MSTCLLEESSRLYRQCRPVDSIQSCLFVSSLRQNLHKWSISRFCPICYYMNRCAQARIAAVSAICAILAWSEATRWSLESGCTPHPTNVTIREWCLGIICMFNTPELNHTRFLSSRIELLEVPLKTELFTQPLNGFYCFSSCPTPVHNFQPRHLKFCFWLPKTIPYWILVAFLAFLAVVAFHWVLTVVAFSSFMQSPACFKIRANLKFDRHFRNI